MKKELPVKELISFDDLKERLGLDSLDITIVMNKSTKTVKHTVFTEDGSYVEELPQNEVFPYIVKMSDDSEVKALVYLTEENYNYFGKFGLDILDNMLFEVKAHTKLNDNGILLLTIKEVFIMRGSH